MHASSLRRTAVGLLAAALLSVPARAQRESAFMQEFRKLMQVHAMDEMSALIKKHEDEAIAAVRETALLMREGTSDVLETDIDALGKAWKKAYDTDFVSLQYDYFALRLSGPFKRQHKDVQKRYDLKRLEFDAAVAAKATERYAGLALEFDALGDQLAELGDHYFASDCYWNCAVLSDDALNDKKSADYRRACEAWGQCVKAREEARLQDRRYAQALERFKHLTADGFGAVVEAPPATAPAAPPAGEPAAAPPPAAALPKTAALGATFHVVADIEAIQRPLYSADSNFQIWNSVPLAKIGSSGTFPALDNSPNVLRTGANKAAVDLDGDGAGDVDIPLTGKITPVEITLGSGAEKRHWAFLSVIGQQQDIYQGFRFNLGPDENQLNLYVAPAGSLVGSVAGTRVQVLDDNMDGHYGSAPRDWGYMGLIEGALQHDLDSVVVGEAKTARPWSRLQKIGDAWYELVPNEAGTDLVATRTDVESGTLQLDLKGAPVTWLVVRGMGDKADLLYDVVNGGSDKVEVPVGTYEIYSGQVASGKKAQMMKALVLPGENTRSWRVGPGETTKLELGAPFTFDFAVQQDAETLTVVGPTIVVVGRGGETYQRLWNCVVTPDVNLRKVGSTRGKKEEELTPIGSQEELQDHENDYRTAWFPIGKPIPKPTPGETFEAQLFQKKHKLFGKIESDWKGK